jgi:hypothetical protein
MNKEDAAGFWRAKGLSARASNFLAKAGISNPEELTDKLTNYDQVFALRNCGRLTAEEIGKFITNFKADSPSPDKLSSYDDLSVRAKNVLASFDITIADMFHFPNSGVDAKTQRLAEELERKDQIIDRLTRMLETPSDAASRPRAVNEAKTIPFDQIRRSKQR